ncbi:retrotransposon protein, putative, ty1-copia subclass [Tanacetum coccineum]
MTCHHCKEVGHWRKNCLVYLAELMKKKKQVGSASTLEASGRGAKLEEIQDEDTSPSENTSEQLVEAERLEPQIDVAPIRRFKKTHRAPDRLCLNLEVEEHSLGDLDKPTNYKSSLSDPKFDKWLDVMNAKMQSMKDNQVWCLIDLSPDAKTVGSK